MVCANLQLKGKIVALNFWFVGCLPCRQEIPVLNQLVERYKDVVFLGFALDGEAQLTDFLKKFPFHYEIVPDAQKIADGFRVAAYPTHILINPAVLKKWWQGRNRTDASPLKREIYR